MSTMVSRLRMMRMDCSPTPLCGRKFLVALPSRTRKCADVYVGPTFQMMRMDFPLSAD